MKFVFLADTHVGGSDTSGYMQQPRHLAHLPELIGLLAEWIDEQRDIDFVIHGGDVVESTTPENIRIAADLFSRLPCPTYLALGNHDLTTKNAVACWLEHAPQFFIGNEVDFFFVNDKIRVDIICCHWGKIPYFWRSSEPQNPYFLPAQLEMLNTRDQGKCRILVTHANLCGVPCEQSGMDYLLHVPGKTFSDELKQLTQKFRVSLVLGAHNHINLNTKLNNVRYVTGSAFCETPFEFKLFDFTDSHFTMKTISFSDYVNFKYKYDFNKTFVQGRLCDRSFKEHFQN
ncbi:MAG: metallophosphoesterase [Victivallaceae bacterium]|nr:metallophosphoesterase [Victivallaceae bacterium]